MPFTAHDLRYKAEETYPALYAHLTRHAQRFLQSLKYDAVELDLVVGHVVEHLVRLGLLGGGDKTPLTALDRLSDACVRLNRVPQRPDDCEDPVLQCRRLHFPDRFSEEGKEGIGDFLT